MATRQMSDVLSHLRRTLFREDRASRTDGQLLEDYVSERDDAALAELVRRHGPMVWGVCRRVLAHYHDAEDAFQATFLVFVRKAASIASPALLANWLYGVAHQTALKARADTAKRRKREPQLIEMPARAATEPCLWNEVLPLLDQELSRLPNKYRVAIILCDLEGKTRKQAARQLGVPVGTLAAQVARGRALLARRFAQHGLVICGATLGAVLAQHAAASVPNSLVSITIKAAPHFAARQAAATALISPKVAGLTQGVLNTMALTKLKTLLAAVLVLGMIGFGNTLLTRYTAAGQPTDRTEKTATEPQESPAAKLAPPKKPAPAQQRTDDFRDSDKLLIEAVFDAARPQGIPGAKLGAFVQLATWKLTALDAAKKTVNLRWSEQIALNDLTVAADAVVFIDGRQKQFADLKPGMWVTPKLGPTKTQITRIDATSNEADLYAVSSVNVEQSMIKLRLGGFGVEFPVAKDARITIRNEPAKLADLQVGMHVAIELGVADDRIAVKMLRVTAPR